MLVRRLLRTSKFSTSRRPRIMSQKTKPLPSGSGGSVSSKTSKLGTDAQEKEQQLPSKQQPPADSEEDLRVVSSVLFRSVQFRSFWRSPPSHYQHRSLSQHNTSPSLSLLHRSSNFFQRSSLAALGEGKAISSYGGRPESTNSVSRGLNELSRGSA